MIGKNIFIVFILLISLNIAYANDENNEIVEASVSHSKVAVGETFVLTIIINDASSKIDPPYIEHAKHMATSQKKNIVYSGGQRKSNTIYAYTYIAQEVGDGVVDPIEITIKRQNYYTPPIYFDIVENTNTSSSNSGNSSNNSFFNFSNNQVESIDKEIFIKSTLSKTNVYIYEPLYFEQSVYLSDSIYAEIAAFDKAGEKNDFIVKRDENKSNAKNENIGGKRYVKHALSKEVLFAIFSGERIINENLYTFNVSSKFIGFNDRIQMGGESFVINVLPLPESGKPESFSGGVGEFDISISVDKDSVSKDESFILKVMASGIGYADSIDLPNIEHLLSSKYGSTLDIYSPKQFATNDIKNGKIYAEKIDEYMIVVKDDSSAFLGKIELEPIDFSFFSPQKEEYITLQTQKIELSVLGQNNADLNNNIAQTPTINNIRERNIIDEPKDILLPIKEGNIKIQRESFLYQKSFIYIYLSISIFILSTSFLVKRFAIPHFTNKKGQKYAVSFEAAIKYLQAGDVKTYVKEIERIFYENISSKLKQKIGNSMEMNEVLKANNVDIVLQNKANDTIELCHYVLYSPATTSDKNYIERKRQVENILKQMRHVIDNL